MKLTLALAGFGLALTTTAALADEPAPKVQVERHIMVIGDGPGDMDKNGDGEITRDEFMAPHADMFARLDADKNGKLSKAELEKGASWTSEDGSRREVFIHGPDGPGGPGPMMFHGPGGPDGPGSMMIMHGPGAPGERRVEIVQLDHAGHGPGELDANKDGKVSFEEFEAPMKDAFQAMDADKSGFLEEGERARGPIRIEKRVEKSETK